MNGPVRAHVLPGDAPVPAGALATCRLTPLDGGPARLVVLTRDPAAPWAVDDALDLHRDRATVAALVEFDGPRSPEQVDADRFASTHRVGPAAAQVPGTGGALVLRAADGAAAVVALGASPEALEAASRAILSTPLLPGEDPSLLRGPDRYTPCAVDGGAALVDALAPAGAR